MTTTLPHTRRGLRRTLTVGVVGLALVATTASGSDEPAQKVDAPTGGGDQSDTFAVGDHVALGGWTIIAHGVTDPLTPGSEFLAPEPGNRWVAVDVEATNTGDSPETMSSVMCFDLLDSTNRSHTVTITGSGASTLDGGVGPGASLRGDLEFEIPEDATGLKLVFSCDLTSSSSATIALD